MTGVQTCALPIYLCNFIPGLLILSIVVIKLIAPNKLLIPDRCKANIGLPVVYVPNVNSCIIYILYIRIPD